MVTLIKEEREFEKLISGTGLVVVDFFANWCAPCKNIAPFFESLSQKHQSVKFIKVDVDLAEGIASTKNVKAMPTFQIYLCGNLIDEIIGAEEATLEAKVVEHTRKLARNDRISTILPINTDVGTVLVEDTLGLTSTDQALLAGLKVPVPSNENERIKVLRQTHLLNSDAEEATFDRFTALARRIFKIPIAAITLVDVDRAWFKSIEGLDAQEAPRDNVFCSYTILPESPEVLVIEDLSIDPRSRDNPLVTGPAHLRFYAGAALIVAGVRLGSLCIFDTVPHIGFDIENTRNLLDFGDAVASLIRERRDMALNIDKDRISMMVNNMHNIRTPLMAIRIALSLIRADEKVINTSLNGSPQTAPVADTFTNSMEDLESSVAQLSMFVEQTFTLGDTVLSVAGQGPKDVDGAELDAMDQLSKPCNLLRVTCDARDVLVHVDRAQNVVWNVDEKVLTLGEHKSHPDVVKFLLLNVVEKALKLFDSITVSISFCQQDLECKICAGSTSDLEGAFLVEIRMERLGDPSPLSLDTETLAKAIGAVVLDRLLRDVGGSRRLVAFTSQGPGGIGYMMEMRVPCAVLTGGFGTDNVPKVVSSLQLSTAMPIEAKASDPLPHVPSATPSQGPSRSPSHGKLMPPSSSVTAIPPPLSPEESGRPVSVLLIEDSMPIQKMMKKWLERNQCVVTSALNGKLGLGALKKKTFDLTLTDFLMPVMLGLEAVKAYEEWKATTPLAAEHNKDMVLIGMSATASQEEQEEGFEHGMHYYCSKPVNLEVLELVVKAVRERATVSERLAMINASTELPSSSEQSKTTEDIRESTHSSKETKGGVGKKGRFSGLIRSFLQRNNKIVPV